MPLLRRAQVVDGSVDTRPRNIGSGVGRAEDARDSPSANHQQSISVFFHGSSTCLVGSHCVSLSRLSGRQGQGPACLASAPTVWSPQRLPCQTAQRWSPARPGRCSPSWSPSPSMSLDPACRPSSSRWPPCTRCESSSASHRDPRRGHRIRHRPWFRRRHGTADGEVRHRQDTGTDVLLTDVIERLLNDIVGAGAPVAVGERCPRPTGREQAAVAPVQGHQGDAAVVRGAVGQGCVPGVQTRPQQQAARRSTGRRPAVGLVHRDDAARRHRHTGCPSRSM